MKKIIVAGILSLTGCVEDDRVLCKESDAGLSDAGEVGDAGDVACVNEQLIAFPDLLADTER
jgi:hypothetical protein